jgi:hypothetical protein
MLNALLNAMLRFFCFRERLAATHIVFGKSHHIISRVGKFEVAAFFFVADG